jgi:hypothetical protein
MSYNIRVNLKKDEVLPDVFEWIQQQGWKHLVEWRWFKPDYYNLETHYTFQFDDEKQAEWFSLRWT